MKTTVNTTMNKSSILLGLLLCSPLCACIFVVGARVDEQGSIDVETSTPRKQSDAEGAQAARLLEHIRVLSSDEFEGRAPGTHGEELTVEYLTKSFRELGLEPGNPDGTFVQAVPLIGFKGEARGSLRARGQTTDLAFPSECVALSRRFVPQIDVVDSPVVFVGYGIVAPEYGWDDYKGLDVAGKTIVMLVNDPGSADPVDPALFKGRAMTYYGRWTYKYEIAAAKGAAAALIVHETAAAGYPFEVVSQSFGRENFDIETADRNLGRAAVEGWLSLDAAVKLCAAAGQDFQALKQSAQRKDFAPVALDAQGSFHIANTLRQVASKNVVARVRGRDEARRDEWIVYSAHWDHLGRNEHLDGDQIFNGAVDNASGSAALLEIARTFSQASVKPRRSILFLCVTAEEKGLLGSRYYATHPLYPLEQTLCAINIDGLNVWGRTSDIVDVGYGHSTLDDVLIATAAGQSRSVKPDDQPEKGYFYRSDHFEFAKQGVPALDADGGSEFIGKPPEYGREKRDGYTARDYHKPSDEIHPDWDLAGAVEDVQLLRQVGLRVSEADGFPQWRADSEFKARREAMLGARHESAH